MGLTLRCCCLPFAVITALVPLADSMQSSTIFSLQWPHKPGTTCDSWPDAKKECDCLGTLSGCEACLANGVNYVPKQYAQAYHYESLDSCMHPGVGASKEQPRSQCKPTMLALADSKGWGSRSSNRDPQPARSVLRLMRSLTDA